MFCDLILSCLHLRHPVSLHSRWVLIHACWLLNDILDRVNDGWGVPGVTGQGARPPGMPVHPFDLFDGTTHALITDHGLEGRHLRGFVFAGGDGVVGCLLESQLHSAAWVAVRIDILLLGAFLTFDLGRSNLWQLVNVLSHFRSVVETALWILFWQTPFIRVSILVLFDFSPLLDAARRRTRIYRRVFLTGNIWHWRLLF